jgi:hypothetical protein
MDALLKLSQDIRKTVTDREEAKAVALLRTQFEIPTEVRLTAEHLDADTFHVFVAEPVGLCFRYVLDSVGNVGYLCIEGGNDIRISFRTAIQFADTLGKIATGAITLG